MNISGTQITVLTFVWCCFQLEDPLSQKRHNVWSITRHNNRWGHRAKKKTVSALFPGSLLLSCESTSAASHSNDSKMTWVQFVTYVMHEVLFWQPEHVFYSVAELVPVLSHLRRGPRRGVWALGIQCGWGQRSSLHQPLISQRLPLEEHRDEAHTVLEKRNTLALKSPQFLGRMRLKSFPTDFIGNVSISVCCQWTWVDLISKTALKDLLCMTFNHFLCLEWHFEIDESEVGREEAFPPLETISRRAYTKWFVNMWETRHA